MKFFGCLKLFRFMVVGLMLCSVVRVLIRWWVRLVCLVWGIVSSLLCFCSMRLLMCFIM